MRKPFAQFLGAVALLALSTSPALAQGKKDRARLAVTAAQAKIDAVNQIGAAGDVPRLVAQAQAQLRTAQESLAGDHKEQAIADANRAAELADTAMGVATKMRDDAAKQQQAQASVVQDQVDAANARAADAQQAAAAAQADAAAARAQPPVVLASSAPAATTTTVTTETSARPAAAASTVRRTTARRTVHRRTTRHVARRAAPAAVRTTTTVTTHTN